ncbi:hypothetical protein [Spirosoma validum]|uniref:Uncharacterized protein n=1 Tax=Spirosoma validum TaxID=2771355 RepID=A0A927AZ10_9BACT|nr:hypothetical protein [Spirosoma validum]MBD2752481.1 hypothetical protein [Spirosoma validum]
MNQNPTTFSLAQAADIIQMTGGAQAFIDWLYCQEYLTDDLLPSRAAINSRLIISRYLSMPNGENRPELHITVKGIAYFCKKINHGNYLARNWFISDNVHSTKYARRKTII